MSLPVPGGNPIVRLIVLPENVGSDGWAKLGQGVSTRIVLAATDTCNFLISAFEASRFFSIARAPVERCRIIGRRLIAILSEVWYRGNSLFSSTIIRESVYG